ncbi:hypothetical protein [Sphaerisporangium sp. TRM90804]|uniref:hypothetical protein n=1 Tax=Sphaerisporangium sp. TRM90804 TaxID=3031113 RepID=UPI00244C4DF5|nr:hypothetical protein [Sphaerisporangium sp. TRM90804]MDH2423893.1 hypothetical protein [Sphaerisporangium sp. TRM90804]
MLPPAETSGVEIGRRALLLSIGALALTMLVPVMGLALGVVAAVVSVRAWRALSSRRMPIIMPITGFLVSVVSIVLAAAVTWFQSYFGGELTRYTECMKGAGTTTSQQVCLSELERAMERKLPFIPPNSLRLPFAP